MDELEGKMGCLGFRGMRHVLLALAAFFPVSSDAWAWGDQGHKVICEMAFRLVQPNTRAEIRKLISTDDRFDSFSDSCIWPDHPRQRASSGNVCGCAGVGRDRAIRAAARGVA
jgi:S1/P1 Nuclease